MKIIIESLISRLMGIFGQEYYDSEDVGQAIREGLKDLRDGRVDKRPWREVWDEI